MWRGRGGDKQVFRRLRNPLKIFGDIHRKFDLQNFFYPPPSRPSGMTYLSPLESLQASLEAVVNVSRIIVWRIFNRKTTADGEISVSAGLTDFLKKGLVD